MKDTPERVETLYDDLLLQRSGAERVTMAFDMFDAARAIVRASLEESSDPRPLHVQLFLRTYGQDFDEETRGRICAWLARPRPAYEGR